MNAEDLADRLTAALGEDVTCAPRSARRLWVRLPPERLPDALDWLRKNVPGIRLATSTGIDLRQGVGVFHHFAVNGQPLVVTLKVLATRPELAVPSLAAVLPAARWIEREIAEFLGVEFRGHPDPRRLLKAKGVPDDVHPLRRDFDPGALRRGEARGGAT